MVRMTFSMDKSKELIVRLLAAYACSIRTSNTRRIKWESAVETGNEPKFAHRILRASMYGEKDKCHDIFLIDLYYIVLPYAYRSSIY
jgi:hypothetical protein